MQTNLISVVLATYNGNHHRLTEAIDSVLSQSYKNFEFIIINDASTNDIEKTILKYVEQDTRIMYLKNKTNLGLTASLNKGIQQSSGKYIARIDDDDVWHDVTKLQKQIDFMENHPEYGLCGTGVISIDEGGKEIGKTLNREQDTDIRKHILGSNQFAHPSIIMRESIVDQIQGYRDIIDTKYTEDYDMRLRMGQVSKFHNLPIYALKYRVRTGSISGSKRFKQQWNALKISRKYRKHYPHPISGILKHCISTFLPKQFVQWLVGLRK